MEKGVSIISDGCSDSKRNILMNSMTIARGEPMLLEAVDCLGETKDKYFILT